MWKRNRVNRLLKDTWYYFFISLLRINEKFIVTVIDVELFVVT